MLKEQLNSVRDCLKKCKGQKRGLELKGELYSNVMDKYFFGGEGGFILRLLYKRMFSVQVTDHM